MTVLAADTGQGQAIQDLGFSFVPLPLSRKGGNPFVEWRTIRFLRQFYRQQRFDLVHHVTAKPVIYGSLAARSVPQLAVVNAITGLGYVFSHHRKARCLRPLVRLLYRRALRRQRSVTIFQNHDDCREFVETGLVPARQAIVIRGSGVDCEQFCARPLPSGAPIVMLAARMLWDKGIREFVEAARQVRAHHPSARCVLVGGEDPGNPAAIPHAQLTAWQQEGVVEWWGPRSDMPACLAEASLVVQPTTSREGLPKVLLEAAACGRPLIATDVPGCREILQPGINGLLVPPRDSNALAEAIITLLRDPTRCHAFGEAGRLLVEREFSLPLVIERTLAVYDQLLGSVLACPVSNVRRLDSRPELLS